MSVEQDRVDVAGDRSEAQDTMPVCWWCSEPPTPVGTSSLAFLCHEQQPEQDDTSSSSRRQDDD